jgi:hypothetical protein
VLLKVAPWEALQLIPPCDGYNFCLVQQLGQGADKKTARAKVPLTPLRKLRLVPRLGYPQELVVMVLHDNIFTSLRASHWQPEGFFFFRRSRII